jgi:release factor glutamine methyltransferase
MTDTAKGQTWTIGDVVRWATDDFRTRGIENPRLDAEVLLCHALGTTRVQLIVDSRRPLEGDELAAFRELVKRRRRREPVAYLLGSREFYGRSFRVDKRVLVPRPDTEILVQVALERTEACSLSTRALDLCTGSGCVAITLGRERPTARVLGTDISPDALAVARENQLRLGAYNVAFLQGDLFGALDGAGPFDVITANPPYISLADMASLPPDVRDFEPRLALEGGADGLDYYRRIVRDAPAHLAPKGCLVVEVGAGEAPDVASLFEKAGFHAVEIRRDYGQIERVVSGIWPQGSEGSQGD